MSYVKMEDLQEIISTAVTTAVTQMVTVLEDKGVLSKTNQSNHTTKPAPNAYQKTETLLYNYTNFKKIIAERMVEIEEIRQYGVRKDMSVQEYVQKGGMPHGLVLEEESVEAAVRNVQRSVEPVVDAVRLLDTSMGKLKSDPYYSILELLYFEGRTQEYVALKLNCTQAAVSQNKSRLVRELSMWLFPSKVISEYLS